MYACVQQKHSWNARANSRRNLPANNKKEKALELEQQDTCVCVKKRTQKKNSFCGGGGLLSHHEPPSLGDNTRSHQKIGTNTRRVRHNRPQQITFKVVFQGVSVSTYIKTKQHVQRFPGQARVSRKYQSSGLHVFRAFSRVISFVFKISTSTRA